MFTALRISRGYGTSTYAESQSSIDIQLFLAQPPPWKEASPHLISDAISAAGADAGNVSNETKEAAHTLIGLVAALPDPQVTVEPSGEISFEWYKDRHHVVVLTVDGHYIRWAAMIGPNGQISDKAPFDSASREVPDAALRAVNSVA